MSEIKCGEGVRKKEYYKGYYKSYEFLHEINFPYLGLIEISIVIGIINHLPNTKF